MLPVGYILKDKYRILGHIASGGFGNTYLAVTLANNVKVAVKEFFMKDINAYDENNNVVIANSNNRALFQKQMEKFLKEAQTLACIDNAHVVHVTESFQLNQTAFYVMEYVDGKTLAQIIKDNGAPLPIDKATDIFLQVADALYAIHKKAVLHLDIKPSNIMVDKAGVAKVIDFGTAKIYNEGTDTISTFTPAYAPMEVHQHRPDAIGQWTDIYSLGATFYYVITGKRPPQDTDIVESGNKAFLFGDAIDQKTRNLIIWMMRPSRKERPQNVQQILKYLESGTLPSTAETDDVTVVDDADNGYATVYEPDHESTTSQRQPPARYGQDGVPTGGKKKSGAGCWVFLFLLILMVGVGHFLYSQGWLDRFLNREAPSVTVNDDSIQEIKDSIYLEKLRQEQEVDYYDQLYSLIDATSERVAQAEYSVQIDSLSRYFESEWDRVNRQFDGVELSDNHQSILMKVLDRLEAQIKEKKQELLNQEIMEIVPSDIFEEDELENGYEPEIVDSVISDMTEEDVPETYVDEDYE